MLGDWVAEVVLRRGPSAERFCGQLEAKGWVRGSRLFVGRMTSDPQKMGWYRGSGSGRRGGMRWGGSGGLGEILGEYFRQTDLG